MVKVLPHVHTLAAAGEEMVMLCAAVEQASAISDAARRCKRAMMPVGAGGGEGQLANKRGQPALATRRVVSKYSAETLRCCTLGGAV
jgi:hypothetical protein